MGRTSKRNAAARDAAGRKTGACHGGRRHKAGIYARLSSDQDARKNESVDAQIEIARKFVEEFNRSKAGEEIDVVECYVDLGKTGSSFEREGFLRLMQDVRLGEIDCVIVKDLSRFGRNYLEAGNYIEKIFPFLGVRFIAVADGLDTGREGDGSRQMATEIKNLVNDMYAKDFSKKARLHLKQRREEGSYVGGPPPYGYLAGWDGKRRVLIPDESTEGIVRFIYEKFVETESYAAVADALNRRRIHPPYLYKKTKEVCHTGDGEAYKGWDKGAVERIVKSETYIGTLVQGKTSITARDERSRVHKRREEWVVTPGAHEPIVGEELRRKSVEACRKIQNRTARHRHLAEVPMGENIFGHVLYCGACGRKMTRSSHVKQHADGGKARLDGYFCLNGGQTKVTACPTSNRISKNEILSILLPLVRKEFDIFLGRPERYVEYGKGRMAEAAKQAGARLRDAEGEIRRLREGESDAYMDYRAGKISQKDYASRKIRNEERLEELERRRQGLEDEKNGLEKIEAKHIEAIRALLSLRDGSVLTKDMVEAFFSRIYVYPGKRVEVLFSFTPGCMEGVA